MNAYVALVSAITGEVNATTALKSSSSFTKRAPSIITVIGYSVALIVAGVGVVNLLSRSGEH